MMLRRIADLGPLYDNAPAIPDGGSWPARWEEPSRLFREEMTRAGRARLGLRYGPEERNVFDLFLPDGTPRGLVVFVHGGFWMGLDKSYWSHLAAGPLFHGHAVAMPSYTLCPQIRISGITREIGTAITAASACVAGPVRLAGHSAGGHLVTRMVCDTSPLADHVQGRIARVLSISGLHDLRPLRRTWRQEKLKIDAEEGLLESPALLTPKQGAQVACWAGASETSEFRRQNALLANIWQGLGAATFCHEEPDRHHFNVVDALADPNHPMVRLLLEECGMPACSITA